MKKTGLFEKITKSKLYPLWLILGLSFWAVFSIFFAQIVCGLIFSWLFGDFSASAGTTTAYNAVYYSLALVLTIFGPYKLFKKLPPSREILGIKGLPTWIDIGLAPVGFFAYLLLANLLTAIFELFPWFNVSESQDVGYGFLATNFDFFVAFLALVVIAPIAEELIFRGWLYGNLREKLPKKVSLPLSILVVSLVFALLHGQLNVGVSVFAMSVVLCLMREITGTAYSGMILHIIKNAIAFYLLFVV